MPRISPMAVSKRRRKHQVNPICGFEGAYFLRSFDTNRKKMVNGVGSYGGRRFPMLNLYGATPNSPFAVSQRGRNQAVKSYVGWKVHIFCDLLPPTASKLVNGVGSRGGRHFPMLNLWGHASNFASGCFTQTQKSGSKSDMRV